MTRPAYRITAIPQTGQRAEPPADPAPSQAWIEPVTRSLVVVVPVAGDGERYELLSMPLSRAGTIAQEFRLGEYIGFVLTLALAVTVAFQMPLVILLLGWAGIADRSFLKKNRRYAVLVCAVLGAILTPADVISMVLLFVPLYLLYELGILLLSLAPADRVAGGNVISGALGGLSAREDDDYGTSDPTQTTEPEQTDPNVTDSDGDTESGPVDGDADTDDEDGAGRPGS